MPTIPTHWYICCQRAIWAMRNAGLNGPLLFTGDRVRLIWQVELSKASNDNVAN